MKQREAWSEQDQQWVARYRSLMTAAHVPADALDDRERELFAAVGEAGQPAADLFGDAAELAAEDAAELATVDEEVRTSLGGGLRPALWEVGGTLTGLGAVASVLMFIRSGPTVDIDTGSALVAASVLVAFVGWIAARALFEAGRSASALGALLVVVALALTGIAAAASLGPDHVAASDVPVLLLVLPMLAPGVLTLMASRRMRQQGLRESWTDDEWLRRFRGGLLARLMPSATAREHVAEVEQALSHGGPSAYAEFGHPLVLARELAAADRGTRARRWWASAIAGTTAPLLVVALILAGRSWGPLTIPVAVVLVLAALLSLASRWDQRPWAQAR